MVDKCPADPDPDKLNVDLGALGNSLLVKKHETRDDAEIVTMRDFKDLREAAAFLGSQLSCDQRNAVMANVFGYGARTKQFRGCQ